MPDIPDVEGGDFFGLGMDSYTQPLKLTNGEFVQGINIMVRGGLPQTRPGSRTAFTMPDGNLQGSTMFIPTAGMPQLVFAVDGLIYASEFPFRTYRRLPNLQFSPSSRFVSWCQTLKSTDYDGAGVITFLDNPYSVLIIQDDNTRAGYWDGTNSGHLNPTKSGTYTSGTEVTSPGYDETPVGLWMCWSNNRLWLSKNNKIYASDIGNPLKFTETQYLNEWRAFVLPGNCTGIIETPDQQGILAFTDSVGVFILSSIQDRTQWTSTPGFQKTILPNIGCVSARSLVHQYGMIWWYSSRGMVNLNSALQINLTSRIDIQDNEMFSSKYNMSYDLSGIAGSFYENLVMMAIPNGDKYNTQTMVLDQAPFEGNANAWCGYWSGWRPVEFCKGNISGSERIFVSSADYDGKNRMWEIMTDDKTDNGLPITCTVVTRPHLMGNRDYKIFRYAEIELEEVYGPTSVMISVAGLRGAYQRSGTKGVIATIGQVYADETYGYQSHLIAGSRPQTRVIRTQDSSEPSDCNSACVESPILGLNDKAFSLMVTWSGIAGLSCYRIFTRPEPNTYAGDCETNETTPALLTTEGCGVIGIFSEATPFETFTATRSFSAISPETLLPVSFTATQESAISQEDADRKAYMAAENYVLSQIGQL